MASWLAALRPPRPPQTPFERGVAAYEGGRYDEALAFLDQAEAGAADAPESARARNKRGVVLVAMGRRAEARAAFEAALERDARLTAAVVNRGNLLLEEERIAEAIEQYRAALRLDERHAGAHRNLGIALKRAGKHAESVRHLRTATRLEIAESLGFGRASRAAERA